MSVPVVRGVSVSLVRVMLMVCMFDCVVVAVFCGEVLGFLVVVLLLEAYVLVVYYEYVLDVVLKVDVGVVDVCEDDCVVVDVAVAMFALVMMFVLIVMVS